MKINTYPGMNGRIVNLLRICDTPIDLYAAARIEELEEQVKQLQLEKVITDSHAPEGRNYTNAQYVDLLMKHKLVEEQLNQAVGLLNELDAYLDFSEPIEQGNFIEFQDPSGINAVISRIGEFLSSLSQETEVKP